VRRCRWLMAALGRLQPVKVRWSDAYLFGDVSTECLHECRNIGQVLCLDAGSSQAASEQLDDRHLIGPAVILFVMTRQCGQIENSHVDGLR